MIQEVERPLWLAIGTGKGQQYNFETKELGQKKGLRSYYYYFGLVFVLFL